MADKKRGRPSKKETPDGVDNDTSTSIDIPDGFAADAPAEDFSPLEDPTKERSYTGGDPTGNNQNLPPVSEDPIPEPQYKAPLPNQDQVGSNFFQEKQQPTSGNPTGDAGAGAFGGQQQPPPQQQEQKQPDAPNNLQELSPAEKRKAVEKTADMFIAAYGNYSHVPFAWMGSFNMKKLRKLHKDGEINLDEEQRRDGTTLEEFAIDHNNKVEQSLKTSDETLAAIREPLVDVLMEQNLALTPTQRLLFALGQDLAAKTIMGIRAMREMNSAIEEMKEMHAEKMEKMSKMGGGQAPPPPDNGFGSSSSPNGKVPPTKPPAPAKEEDREPTLDEFMNEGTGVKSADEKALSTDEEEQDIPMDVTEELK